MSSTVVLNKQCSLTRFDLSCVKIFNTLTVHALAAYRCCYYKVTVRPTLGVPLTLVEWLRAVWHTEQLLLLLSSDLLLNKNLRPSTWKFTILASGRIRLLVVKLLKFRAETWKTFACTHRRLTSMPCVVHFSSLFTLVWFISVFFLGWRSDFRVQPRWRGLVSFGL